MFWSWASRVLPIVRTSKTAHWRSIPSACCYRSTEFDQRIASPLLSKRCYARRGGQANPDPSPMPRALLGRGLAIRSEGLEVGDDVGHLLIVGKTGENHGGV